MVGRILSYLKARGVLKEAHRNGISTRKRLWRRPYAIRKPRGYPVMEPGDADGDANGDGKVDILDLATVGAQFGQELE